MMENNTVKEKDLTGNTLMKVQIITTICNVVIIIAIIVLGIKVAMSNYNSGLTEASIAYSEQINNLLYDLEVLVNNPDEDDTSKVNAIKEFIDEYNSKE